MELPYQAKRLCIIITPFGKFQHSIAPMGVKQLPDFAQEVMKDQFHDLDYVKVYIDDIGGLTMHTLLKVECLRH